MLHSSRVLVLALVSISCLAALTACSGDDSNPPGAGGAADASSDAARAADATVDASADAGPHDASAPDATVPDAMAPDAGPLDAGGDVVDQDADTDASTVSIQILQTSDLHANVVNYDYFSGTDQPKSPTRGIAPLATVLRQERAKSACSLTIDSGDTIQGTPLGTYYALVDTTDPHPMAAAFNAVGYDAVALGNHEFNYGLDVLARYTSQLQAPVLAANVVDGTGKPAFGTFIIKSVCGVKVGILGLVTPGAATWDAGDHTKGLTFQRTLTAAEQYVPMMKQQGADVVVITVHQGPEKRPNTAGTPKPADWLTPVSTWVPSLGLPNENEVLAIAEDVVKGQPLPVDVILSGHTHLPIPKIVDNGVLIGQPSYWGADLAEYTINMTRAGGASGKWTVASKDSQIVPVPQNTALDPAVYAAVQDADAKTKAYVSQVIGQSAGPFPGGFQARLVDSPLADLINVVQEEAAERAADAGGFEPPQISLAAIFTNTGSIPQGPVKLSDAYSVYIYDNTLYVMRITGAILRAALEENAQYFRTLAPSPTLAAPTGGASDAGYDAAINDAGQITVLPGSVDDLTAFHNGVFTQPDYNWDIFRGIKYTVDLTQPAGHRVGAITRDADGSTIQDADVFTIALNNYRGGGGGYGAFASGTLLWSSPGGVRDYVASYIQRLSAGADGGAEAGALDPASYPATCDMTLVPNLYSLYFDGGAKCAP